MRRKKKLSTIQSHIDDIFVDQSNILFEKDDEDFINKVYSNKKGKQKNSYDEFIYNPKVSSNYNRNENYVKNSYLSIGQNKNKKFKLSKNY